MAVNLDTTISGEDANGYISVAFYIQYWQNRGVDLSRVSEDNIKIRIIRATQYLDQNYTPLSGQKVVSNQALNFPRSNAIDNDCNPQPYDAIIRPVQYATAELGEYSSTGSLSPERGRSVRRERLDGVGEIEYADSAGVVTRNFDNVDNIMRGIANSTNSGVIRRVRS